MRVVLLLALLIVAGLGLLLLRPPGGPPPAAPTVAGEPVARAPRPAAAPRPGTPLHVTLVEPPVAGYGEARPGEADAALAPLVGRTGVRWDPGLGRAARELAAFYAAEGALAQSDVLAFFLDAAGVSAWGVRQAIVATTEQGDAAIADAVATHLRAESGPWLVGVGEAFRLGDGPGRIIAVLLARPTHTLTPIGRHHAAGRPIRLSGRLLPGHTDPELVVQGPDERFVDVPVRVQGDRFEATVPADEPGTVVAELIAVGAAGPTPLTQLTFHVDEPVPDHLETVWPAADPAADPAGHAARLLNADRERFGLPPLARDARLDAIAQAHCADMQASGFVGHRSPTTGLPADRLAAADYAAAASGENVAYNKSLADAEAGLMRSLGHRRNLLSTDFTHVGLGATRDAEQWYVTQLFATPRPIIDDPAEARATLLARLGAAREEAGAGRLRRQARLERVAQAEADRERPTPQHALDAAGALRLSGKVSAWVGRMGLLGQFVPEGGLLADEFGQVGIGIRQDEATGELRIVILLAR
ncbi:MAG: CAP domain-containing protein [Myxococcales bacterium]|nr:CAP domain-containing protein [Myxococcales bacterium]